MLVLFVGARLRLMGGSTSTSGGDVSRTGVLRVLFGFRTSGKGQVMSLSLSGQNGLMFS